MIRRHPGSTRPDTFFPYTTRFRSVARPVAGLSLSLNGSFNRAKVTDLTDSEAAISGAELGTRLASPHFQGSGTLRYDFPIGDGKTRSEEHTSELQSIMLHSSAVFCLKKKKTRNTQHEQQQKH